MAIQGDFVSKTSKPTNQPQTCFKEFSFCQGGDGKLLEGKKNLQTTQISFVKCFETVLRIAAQILQSNKRKNTVLSQFSVRGRKDFTPVGGHAVNGHQQRVRRQRASKDLVHHFSHAKSRKADSAHLSPNQCVNKNRENSNAIFMNYRVQSSLNPTLLRNSTLAA